MTDAGFVAAGRVVIGRVVTGLGNELAALAVAEFEEREFEAAGLETVLPVEEPLDAAGPEDVLATVFFTVEFAAVADAPFPVELLAAF